MRRRGSVREFNERQQKKSKKLLTTAGVVKDVDCSNATEPEAEFRLIGLAPRLEIKDQFVSGSPMTQTIGPNLRLNEGGNRLTQVLVAKLPVS